MEEDWILLKVPPAHLKCMLFVCIYIAIYIVCSLYLILMAVLTVVVSMHGVCSSAVMAQCWNEDPEKRPTFSELNSITEQFLNLISDYTELSMALTGDITGMCR